MELFKNLFLTSFVLVGGFAAFYNSTFEYRNVAIFIGSLLGLGIGIFILSLSEKSIKEPEETDVVFGGEDLEKVAKILHEYKVRWIGNLFTASSKSSDGAVVIPMDYVKKLEETLCIDFDDLSEAEREFLEKYANRILDKLQET